MHSALIQGASRGIGLALVKHLLASSEQTKVIATSRTPQNSESLKALAQEYGGRLVLVPMDVTEEDSISRAKAQVEEHAERLHLLINVTGILHDTALGIAPEKKLEQCEPSQLSRVFAVNAFGPLLVAKHFYPLMRHDERAVFASISARVGSIGDNGIGGWYSYRASKAAQNMFTKNLAIELGRKCKNLIVLALHPGTVDTELSEPFQGNVPEGKLFSPERAATQLLDVIAARTPEDTGNFYAWDGSPIPW